MVLAPAPSEPALQACYLIAARHEVACFCGRGMFPEWALFAFRLPQKGVTQCQSMSNFMRPELGNVSRMVCDAQEDGCLRRCAVPALIGTSEPGWMILHFGKRFPGRSTESAQIWNDECRYVSNQDYRQCAPRVYLLPHSYPTATPEP